MQAYLYSSVLSPERTMAPFSPRTVAKRKERAEWRGCPRLRSAGARTLPAQIVAVGKSPHLTIPRTPRGKSLRNQNTPASSTSRQTRGDRRRRKTDLSLATQENLALIRVRRTRVSRAVFSSSPSFSLSSVSFPCLSRAARNFRGSIPRANRSAKRRRPPTACET